MIDKISFTSEHIRSLQAAYRSDPVLIEKSIFAFGVLESIALSGLPFCFKGGTSLMLLLEESSRFSTDIDVIVEPDTDMNAYLEVAADIWGLGKFVEQHRQTSGNIGKRHFKFFYNSPLSQDEQTILLDVLLEHNHYTTTVQRSIEAEFLVTSEPDSVVTLPDSNCILGDKITAFAPHTTGIPYGVFKELDIIKQLYDVSRLVDIVDNFSAVKDTYGAVVVTEIEYRGLSIDAATVLEDTIATAVCVAGRGKIRPDEYALLKKGITGLRSYVFKGSYSGETAVRDACKAIYLAASVLTDQDDLPVLQDSDYYKESTLPDAYRALSYVRKLDKLAYKYLFEGAWLLG